MKALPSCRRMRTPRSTHTTTSSSPSQECAHVSRDADPILLEVFRNAFEAIADQMALILMKTAHSPIVRDAMDFSTALCDAAGSNLAQGLTTPMHLGSFYD